MFFLFLFFIRYQFNITGQQTTTRFHEENDDIFLQIPLPRTAFLVQDTKEVIISVNVEKGDEKVHFGFLGSSTRSFGIFFGDTTGSISVHIQNKTVFSFSTIILKQKCDLLYISTDPRLENKVYGGKLKPESSICLWHAVDHESMATLEIKKGKYSNISVNYLSEKMNLQIDENQEWPPDEIENETPTEMSEYTPFNVDENETMTTFVIDDNYSNNNDDDVRVHWMPSPLKHPKVNETTDPKVKNPIIEKHRGNSLTIIRSGERFSHDFSFALRFENQTTTRFQAFNSQISPSHKPQFLVDIQRFPVSSPDIKPPRPDFDFDDDEFRENGESSPKHKPDPPQIAAMVLLFICFLCTITIVICIIFICTKKKQLEEQRIKIALFEKEKLEIESGEKKMPHISIATNPVSPALLLNSQLNGNTTKYSIYNQTDPSDFSSCESGP